MTVAQERALRWLQDHGGTGVVNRYGRLLAAGEVAPFAPDTWLRLVAMGKIVGAEGRLAVA